MADVREEVSGLGNAYGLRVEYIEQYGRAYKLYTDKGEYALKKINANKGLDFLRYVQLLYQRGYNRIVPIYPTLDGRYAILQGKYLYYLMPWLENRRMEGHSEKYQELFRELARLHTLSVREVPINKEERQVHYERTVAQWEKEQEVLDVFIGRCEETVYMSPFQLLYCTYYSEISGGHRFALKKLNEWYEATKEETKARSVIVHGKLSPEHFLYDERGYGFFTNFEQAADASPIHDLLPFLSRALNSQPKQFDESIDWLTTYFKHFSFTTEEMTLLLSYLAHPGPIFRVIEKYFSVGKEKSELAFVRQLQDHYWRMKNIEYVVMQLDAREQQKQSMNESPPPSS